MFFIFSLVIQSLFFFIDMCITGFFSFPLFPFSVACLVVGCYAASSYTECMLLLGPALFHGLFLGGITGAQLGFCITLLLATRWMLMHIHHQHEAVYLLIILYGIFTTIKAYDFLTMTKLIAYTTLVFIGIVSLVYFSLKWLIAVKRGNRL